MYDSSGDTPKVRDPCARVETEPDNAWIRRRVDPGNAADQVRVVWLGATSVRQVAAGTPRPSSMDVCERRGGAAAP